MIVVMQNSVLAARIGYVCIGIDLSRVLVAFLVNFLFLSEIRCFIIILCIGGICSASFKVNDLILVVMKMFLLAVEVRRFV